MAAMAGTYLLAGMFSDPEFAVRSQVVDKRGRRLGKDGRTRKADEAMKRCQLLGCTWRPSISAAMALT
jgi:hypothetical protein